MLPHAPQLSHNTRPLVEMGTMSLTRCTTNYRLEAMNIDMNIDEKGYLMNCAPSNYSLWKVEDFNQAWTLISFHDCFVAHIPLNRDLQRPGLNAITLQRFTLNSANVYRRIFHVHSTSSQVLQSYNLHHPSKSP